MGTPQASASCESCSCRIRLIEDPLVAEMQLLRAPVSRLLIIQHIAEKGVCHGNASGIIRL